MLTSLRRIASCFFFTLAILSAALWVRSYFIFDLVHKRPPPSEIPKMGDTTQLRIAEGLALVQILRFPNYTGRGSWRWWPQPAGRPSTAFPAGRTWEWAQGTSPSGEFFCGALVPLWFPVISFTLLALAIRPKPRLQFGLRDLFTLTTVAALAVGPLTFWLRSIS